MEAALAEMDDILLDMERTVVHVRGRAGVPPTITISQLINQGTMLMDSLDMVQ